ncbi:hypothetical protein LRP88_09466 [Fusarium phalaenopsidis]|nr:Fn3-like domain-containing protein [Fusarium sp. Ph1]
MCSYNRINGSYSCANFKLMVILKEELAFLRSVVSDCAIKNGKVPESHLDDMAERVLTPYFLLNQFDDYPAVDPASGGSFFVYQYGHNSELLLNFPKVPARDVRSNRATLIRQMGAAGTVLLKNVNDTLPLKKQ